MGNNGTAGNAAARNVSSRRFCSALPGKSIERRSTGAPRTAMFFSSLEIETLEMNLVNETASKARNSPDFRETCRPRNNNLWSQIFLFKSSIINEPVELLFVERQIESKRRMDPVHRSLRVVTHRSSTSPSKTFRVEESFRVFRGVPIVIDESPSGFTLDSTAHTARQAKLP